MKIALWFSAAASSTLALALVSLTGLLTGRLAIATLLFGAFGLAGGLQQAMFRARRHRQGIHPAQAPPWPLVLAPVIPLALVAMTAPWNFMMATGMDAGNYEATSSYFAVSGSYWLDASDAFQAASAEVSSIAAPGNTWWFDDTSMSNGRPYYLPLFPALLGAAKFVSSSHGASGYLNILLGGLNAVGIYGLILLLSRSKIFALVGSVLSGVNLVFLYYSKQVMSEQLALTSLLLLVSSSLLLTEFSGKRLGTSRRIPSALKVVISGSVFALMMTKLDSTLPLLLLLGILALTSPFYREVRSLFVYSFSGFFLSIPILDYLIAPSYLRHAGSPVRLPIVGSLQGSRFLYASVAILLFMLSCSMIVRKLVLRSSTQGASTGARDRPNPLSMVHKPSRGMARVIAMILSLGIFLLLILFRPLTSEFEVNHDAFNLIRLFRLWSPLVLAAIFVSFGVLGGKMDTITRIFLLALGAAFVIALVRSQHSAPDLWWSRRYLVVGTVLGTLSVSTVASSWLGWMRQRLSTPSTNIIRINQLSLAVLAAGSLLWQGWVAAPLLAERQNEGVLADALALAEFDPFATLHVVAANRGYVGLGNSVRSLRPGSTVVAMSPEDFEQVVSNLPPGDLILLPQEWAPRLDDLATVVLSGETAGHWANTHAQLGRADREVRRRVVWSLARVTTTDQD